MTPSMNRVDFWEGNINWFSPKDFRSDELRDSEMKITAAAMKETEMTVAEHLKELAEIRDLAKADGRYSAAVSAETSRGKVCGFYSDKVEVKTELSGEVGVKAKLPDSILEMIEANKKRVYADMLERKKGQQKAK